MKSLNKGKLVSQWHSGSNNKPTTPGFDSASFEGENGDSELTQIRARVQLRFLCFGCLAQLGERRPYKP